MTLLIAYISRINNITDMLTRKLSSINEIIIHCTASRASHPITAADVDKMHRQRGFDMIGYNFVVEIDGKVVPGRPLGFVPAHCKGHNRRSIGIAYVGGLDERGNSCDTRNALQQRAMVELISNLLYFLPNITKISGHCDYSKKSCPCFDAGREYSALLSSVPRLFTGHRTPSMHLSNGLEQASPARDDIIV